MFNKTLYVCNSNKFNFYNVQYLNLFNNTLYSNKFKIIVCNLSQAPPHKNLTARPTPMLTSGFNAPWIQ